MKYLYKYAYLSNKSNSILKIIDSACNRIERKIVSLNIESLPISSYNKIYLANYKSEIKKVLQRYAYILALSLTSLKKEEKNVILLDHGGGVGLISMLVKEVGVGKVIYSDIDARQCQEAEIIAKRLNIPADYYFSGEIKKVANKLNDNSIKIDLIVSNDVIEHIYDIEHFFSELNNLFPSSVTLVMATGANPQNPFIRKDLMKKQLECEYKDREMGKNLNPRDCHKAFFNERMKIIKKYRPMIKGEILKHLTKAARGMTVKDIKECVNKYEQSKKLPPLPGHPTNTCDPYTGNWREHLMNPDELRKILAKNGFRAEILPGFWNHAPKTLLKKATANLANLSIRLLKKDGLAIAPYYIIYAKK